MNIEKTVSNEIRKWASFDMDLFLINDQISSCYNKISLGDYDDKKKYFIRLHYLKIKKNYIYLKIHNNNIKKISNNEKLLYYLESILLAKGYNLEIW